MICVNRQKDMSTSDAVLLELSARAAVAGMRRGDLSAEHYAAALLRRAAAGSQLNAFRTLDHSRVMEAARMADQLRARGSSLGALHGLPIPVKDSVNTKLLPTSNGTLALENFRPRDDAAVLKPLFAQGALLMGKTNLHEISLGWTSNNLSFGAVRNPYDSGRIPGGSSGGSAAAVAARMAPLAVAEDTHGSIRVPAALCGLSGLRPTFGRYPGDGIMPLTQAKFDQPGPLARSVDDLALFDAVLTGDARPITARPLSGVRLGIAPGFFFDGLDADVERVVTSALERLKAAGATIVAAEISEAVKAAPTIAFTIVGFEVAAALSDFLLEQQTGIAFDEMLERMGANVGQLLKTAILPPNGVPVEAYQQALRLREALKASVQGYFRDGNIDALVFPPVLCPAPALGDNEEIEIGGHKVPITIAIGRNTALAPCAGMPGLVVPAGMTGAGLPVGLEFEGLPGTDRELLALGLSVEQVLGRLPPPTLAHGNAN